MTSNSPRRSPSARGDVSRLHREARPESGDLIDSRPWADSGPEHIMTHDSHSSTSTAAFELYFPSLRLSTPALSFPCDAGGDVWLDTLGERARDNYLFARALMGRDYGMPTVQATRHG